MSCIRGSNPGPPHYECGAITSYANAALKDGLKVWHRNTEFRSVDRTTMEQESFIVCLPPPYELQQSQQAIHRVTRTIFRNMTKSSFMGGSLSFKGDKKKSKKKRKPKHTFEEDKKKMQTIDVGSDEEDMTEAEKGAHKFKLERQRQESEAIAKKSHRERVEELNEKLGSLTEHNDIPRVSAAGNG